MSDVKSKSNRAITPSGSSGNLSSITIDRENCDDDDDMGILNLDLLDKMDIEDVEDLKNHFFNQERICLESDSKHLTENLIRGLPLTKVDFIEAMEKLCGTPMVSLAAAKLFERLDPGGEGSIRWETVLDAIIEKTKGPLERKAESWQPINSEIAIHSATHCKREFIVKIVSLHTKLTFCYAVVSKLGRVGVYDGEFHLLDTYKIGLKPEVGNKEFLTGEQEERQRRSQTTWVTDAVFVPDTYAIFFSASDRSLHLYDATGLIHVPLCLISGLRNTPTCLDYFTVNDHAKPSFLFFGDDQGDVTTMEFHQPKKSLFRKKDPDKLDRFLWTELKEQQDYVSCRVQKKVHDDVVLQISYNSENKTLLTCSNDPINTMVLRHIGKRRRPYVFRVPRGIRCFHLERSLHIIATGSNDCLVRIWNQVVTKQPVISLHGHRAPVVDVRILNHLSAIISLSERGVVKIWNLDDYYCQASVQINFPVLKVQASTVEYGTKSIYPGPTVSNVFEELAADSRDASKITSFAEDIETWLTSRDFELREDQEWNRNSVVVICCNYMALLKLTPMVTDDTDVPALLKKYRIFPPPSRELYASVPSPWKVADSFTRTPPESEDASTAKSSSSSSTRNVPLSRTLKKVQSITADPVKAPMKNMNMKRTQLQIKQEQMKMLVEHCAPHLALDLYDIAPIKFSRPLPVTRRMMDKGIDVSDPEHLLRGKIQKDSTVTTGDTFSEVLSQHSSKSSKLAGSKRTSSLLKGRQTPDWFLQRVKTSDDRENSSASSKSNS